MKTTRFAASLSPVSLSAVALVAVLLTGCSRELQQDAVTSPTTAPLVTGAGNLAPGPDGATIRPVEVQSADQPPAGVATIHVEGREVALWPYTGASFDGQPSDPVNLVFVGQVDPVRLRSALLSLDGDRTAFGFPAAYPFNARWSDAMGDVQTTYAHGQGWVGSVVQLQLGDYQPVRVHLRLFRAGPELTLGAAHFELMIPGTADHQVLSWELAEKVVLADFARSGLLDPTHAPGTTGPLNAAPGFREIPDFLYNQLPPDVIAAIGGPPTPVSGGVPIGTDGEATVLHVTGTPDLVTGPRTQSFSLTYGQVIPKPFCMDGPGEWLYVNGPVAFESNVVAGADGSYEYRSGITGRLTATPVDVTVNPPRPIGEPIPVSVSDRQDGTLDAHLETVSAQSVRLLTAKGGSEFRRTELRLTDPGRGRYLASTHCRQP